MEADSYIACINLYARWTGASRNLTNRNMGPAFISCWNATLNMTFKHNNKLFKNGLSTKVQISRKHGYKFIKFRGAKFWALHGRCISNFLSITVYLPAWRKNHLLGHCNPKNREFGYWKKNQGILLPENRDIGYYKLRKGNWDNLWICVIHLARILKLLKALNEDDSSQLAYLLQLAYSKASAFWNSRWSLD